MKRCLLPLIAAALVLFAGPVSAQSPDVNTEERDVVRLTHMPDGSKSIYKRNRREKGMLCYTYTPKGKLAAVTQYHEGKFGQLVACHIFQEKKLIYKVSYGYDSNARLIEERMYTADAGELVQRVIYKYDSSGQRSKPIIISLNKARPIIDPTAQENVNEIYNSSNRGSGRTPR